MKTWAEEYGFGEACQILSALGRTFNLLNSGNVSLKELLQAPAGSGPKQVTNTSHHSFCQIFSEETPEKQQFISKRNGTKLNAVNEMPKSVQKNVYECPGCSETHSAHVTPRLFKSCIMHKVWSKNDKSCSCDW